MISNDDTCEDEWNELQARFKKEGLEYSGLTAEQKLLQVWRWLVDAESNLLSSRRMLDKLREQQHEELEEMECYMGHIRDLAEKRADHLENETQSLRNQLDSNQQQTATLNTLLQKSGLQGLAGIGEDSLGEQVAFLIADRAKLMEEIDVLKKIKFSNGVNKDGDLLGEVVKISSEKEVFRREIVDMCEKLQSVEKTARQLELDNERLAFKLSEALAELEEREAQLKVLGGNEQVMSSSLGSSGVGESLVWNAPPQGVCARSFSLHSGLSRREASQSSLKTATGEFESSSALIRNQSDSSLLDRTDGGTHHDRISRTDTRSYGADSTPPSLLSEPNTSCSSPKRISFTDPQSAASNELSRLEELKKLQTECSSLKEAQATLSEKYNSLVYRFIRYKAKRKAQIEDLRRRMDIGMSTLQCEVDSLQAELALQKKAFQGEESFRKRVEGDYRRLQDEKRNLVVGMLDSESALRAKDREVTTLQKKVAFLENSNADLLARVLTLKYAGSSNTNTSRSTGTGTVTGANVKRHSVTDLGSV